MPPKAASVPKLTKKQLEEQKKKQEQTRKQQQQLLKQQQQADKIERDKKEAKERLIREEQERVRVEEEKNKWQATAEQRRNGELKEQKDQEAMKEWKKIISSGPGGQIVKGTNKSTAAATRQQSNAFLPTLDSSGTNLSTFLYLFSTNPLSEPARLLDLCEDAQLYIRNLKERQLFYRAEGQLQKETDCKKAQIKIRELQLKRIEQIMVGFATQAEEMEEKNSYFEKNKNQPTKKADAQLKILEYVFEHSPNFKIGMYLNSVTTKSTNKFRPIEIKEFGLNTEVPAKWINANTIVRFEWVNFDPYQKTLGQNESGSFRSSSTAPQSYIVLGGVYSFTFYELVLGSKRINNITMKKCFANHQLLQKHRLSPALIKEPFHVMYTLPKDLFLEGSILKIAQWGIENVNLNNTLGMTSNSNAFNMSNNPGASPGGLSPGNTMRDGSGRWTILSNDSIAQFQKDTKMLICKIYRPQSIAFVQQRRTDYPYLAWEMRSTEKGKVLLDLELRRWVHNSHSNKPVAPSFSNSKNPSMSNSHCHLHLTFEILPSSLTLIMHKQYPQLASLCNHPMPIEALLYQLSRRGVHLLPQQQDLENDDDQQHQIGGLSPTKSTGHQGEANNGNNNEQPPQTDSIQNSPSVAKDHQAIPSSPSPLPQVSATSNPYNTPPRSPLHLPHIDPQAEQHAITDLAYAVQSYYIRSQPHMGPTVAVKMRQNLDYQPVYLEDQEKDWKKVRWAKERSWIEGMKEKHLNFETLLQCHPISLPQCLQTIQDDRSYLLRLTVKKVLSLTRILAFTTGKQRSDSRLKEVLRDSYVIK